MCGPVSFKRGEAFFRGNKVIVDRDTPERCEAIVTGVEDFYVTIEKDEIGGFRTSCSCPSLASFQKDCQHIAAVLLTIAEQQRKREIPKKIHTHPLDFPADQHHTKSLFTLFKDQPTRASSHQLHFENRKTIQVEFICKLVTVGKGRQMFGIGVKLGSIEVKHIRDFIQHVKNGNSYVLSPLFTYEPSLHCFDQASNDVLMHLFQVIEDEKVYADALSNRTDVINDHQIVLVPPSPWVQLIPMLEKVPAFSLIYDGEFYEGFHRSKEPLSLQFHLDYGEKECEKYRLKIKGLNEMVVLHDYHSVLSDGKFIQLKSDEFSRLSELKGMVENSGSNIIPIHQSEIDFFLEKVVPGLKRIGKVEISAGISENLRKTPLIAKLYLDRVNNRLLAGLEFHYENWTINPLESREPQIGALLIRDKEKEQVILQLMEDSSFFQTESGYYLHNEELEYEFLYHVVPKLQPFVQIYATTAVRNRVFSGSNTPMIRVKMKKERTNWLEFKFEMDGISDKEIREVLSALEEKRKYYRLRNGSLMSLESREFEALKRFLNELPLQKKDLESSFDVPIVRGLHLLDSVDNPDAFRLEKSFREFLQNINDPDTLAFEVPKGVEPILRDYQKHGFKWMKTLAYYGFGGILG